MKRLVIVIVWLLSIPSIAFSQRGAWTTKEGQLSSMIMSDEGRDSIEWMDVNGVLGAVDIATIRSLPSLKRLNIRGCKIKEIPDSAFYGMPNLEVIKLPRKAKIIGAVILKNCPRLRKVKEEKVDLGVTLEHKSFSFLYESLFLGSPNFLCKEERFSVLLPLDGRFGGSDEVQG